MKRSFLPLLAMAALVAFAIPAGAAGLDFHSATQVLPDAGQIFAGLAADPFTAMAATAVAATDPETAKATVTGARAKLKAYATDNAGDNEFTLPNTGVVVTYPKVIKHGAWMKAQRLAGPGESAKAQALYIVGVCQFEGEKFTEADFSELVPTKDSLALIGEVFGNDKQTDAAGNA